jgi:hypothetical protein
MFLPVEVVRGAERVNHTHDVPSRSWRRCTGRLPMGTFKQLSPCHAKDGRSLNFFRDPGGTPTLFLAVLGAV